MEVQVGNPATMGSTDTMFHFYSVTNKAIYFAGSGDIFIPSGGYSFGDGVLYKSNDNGNSWTPVNISTDWRYIEMCELPNGDLICSHGFGAQPPSATYVGSSLAVSPMTKGSNWMDLNVMSGMAFCA